MADCKVTGLNKEQVKEALRNRELFFTTSTDQTSQQTLEILDFVQNRLELTIKVDEEGKERYYLDEEKIKKRPSDLSSSHFNKLNKGRAEEISSIPDNKTSALAGTFTHMINAELMDFFNKGIGNLADIKNKALNSSDFSMNEKSFNNMVNLIKSLISQINRIQNKIDSNGKANILVEQKILDPLKSVGGAIDVLVIFSDNTAAIYDYKTLKPSFDKVKGFGENATLTDDPMYSSKLNGYQLTMGEYKRILQDIYGIKKVRQSRLIPIHIQLEKKKNSKPGNSFNNKILLLETDNEFLKQIPVAGETTEDKGIDTIIKNQQRVIQKLEEQLDKVSVSYEEKQRIRQRITQINQSMRNLLVDGEINSIRREVYELMNYIKGILSQPEELENGEVNPEYPSLAVLQQLYKELSVYENINANLIDYIDKLDKVNKEKKEKIENESIVLSHNISKVLHSLNARIENSILSEISDSSKDSSGKLVNTQELDWWDRYFGKLSTINHPIFKKFRELKDKAINRTLRKVQELYDEVDDKTTALNKWANKRGMSLTKAFDLLINKKTGNLYSKHKAEFYKSIERAYEEKDVKELQRIYELKDVEKFKEYYLNRKKVWEEKFKAQYGYDFKQNKFVDILDQNNDVIFSAKSNEKKYNERMEQWIAENNIGDTSNKLAWLNKNNRRYLKIRESVSKQNYSDEYIFILNNKELNDYYEMYHRRNSEFRELLGISWNKLPPNFIANIRKDVVEKFLSGGLKPGDALSEFFDSFNIREEDEHIGIYDENGELQKNIPMLFLNPFYDKDGKLNLKEKSYELSKNLILFGKMAYNYSHMSEIEAQSLALRETLSHLREDKLSVKGKRLKDKWGNLVQKTTGLNSDTYSLFDDMINYYIYGIKFKDKGKNFKIFGKEINSTKTLLRLKSIYGMKTLGLAVIPGIGAWTAGQLGAYYEEKKGISFERKHRLDAIKSLVSERDKAISIAEFFHPYSEDFTYKYATKLRNEKTAKFLSSRNYFAPLRLPDENIANIVTNAMARNWGIDKTTGNLVRMNRKGIDVSNVTPIWELASIGEDGKLKLDISEENYIAFRNAVRSTMSNIIGNMSDEDISKVDTSLTLNLMMQFKSWMPGVVRERTGKLHYDESIQSFRYGRFRALFSEYQIQEGEEMMSYLKDVVVPKIGKLVIDLLTFGIAPKMFGSSFRINEGRAKIHFNNWLNEMSEINPNIRNEITFDDYLDIKTKQIRAAISEMRAIMLFFSILSMLGGDWDDDDKPDYRKFWITRNLYKSLSRAESELTFVWNPDEFIRLVSNPLPLAKILVDAKKTITNGFQETWYLFDGEERPKQDKTPFFYYSSQWIYGVTQMKRFIEIWEQDKKVIR